MGCFFEWALQYITIKILFFKCLKLLTITVDNFLATLLYYFSRVLYFCTAHNQNTWNIIITSLLLCRHFSCFYF